MTTSPDSIDAVLVQSLRDGGLSDVQIEDAANVIWTFNLVNRLADAFDFPMPNAKQRVRASRMINLMGRARVGATPRGATTRQRDDDGVWRPPLVIEGRRAMLDADRAIPAELRRTIEAWSAGAHGAERPEVTLPDELAGYVGKVCHAAYKIVDEEVDALKEAGHSDAAIYEITVAAAMGAAFAGLERVYGALEGEGANRERGAVSNTPPERPA